MKQLFYCIALVSLFSPIWAQRGTKDIVLNIRHKIGDKDLVLNKNTYQLPDGRTFRIDKLYYYFSNPVLIKDGTNNTLDRLYVLVDGKTTSYPLGKYDVPKPQTIRLNVGVDNKSNHADPTAWPPDHPLSLQKADFMHWGWAAGYRFLLLEGMIDSNGDGVVDKSFSYHAVGDQFLTTTDVQITPVETGDRYDINLKADYLRLLNGISFNALIIHGAEDPIPTLMSNFDKQKVFTNDDATSNTGDLDTPPVSVTQVPNPASGKALFNFVFRNSNSVSLQVMDENGRVVHRHNGLSAQGSYELSVTGWTPGLYYYAFFDGNRLLYSDRLMVVR